MKIKETKDGLYTIKGLELAHLEVIYSLLYNVVLGTEGYPNKAADLAIMLEKFDITNTCEPTIEITLT